MSTDSFQNNLTHKLFVYNSHIFTIGFSMEYCTRVDML